MKRRSCYGDFNVNLHINTSKVKREEQKNWRAEELKNDEKMKQLESWFVTLAGKDHLKQDKNTTLYRTWKVFISQMFKW